MTDFLPILKDVLLTTVNGVLVVAVPILVKALFDWVAAQKKVVEANLSEQQRLALQFAASLAVQAAEQKGLAGAVSNKLTYATEFAEKWLKNQGYEVQLDELEKVLEAALWENINQFDPRKNKALQN